MGLDDPELPADVDQYVVRDRPAPGHGVASVLLLVVQFGFAAVALFVVSMFTMSTDSCGYVACGDQRWVGRAMFAQTYGALAVLIVSTVLVVWRLVKRRRVLWIALSALGLQLVTVVIALVMMKQAGPLA